MEIFKSASKLVFLIMALATVAGMFMNKITKKVFTNPIYFLAFGFGSGLMPKAP